MSCLETTETHLECEEQTSMAMESEEAPKEDAVVKPVNGRKKCRRGQKLTVGRRGEPKELTRSDCRSGKKLAAACRKVSNCATVAWCERNFLRKIGTQGKCGPRKRLTAAGIKMTLHARVSWRRENYVRKHWTRSQAEQ
jgi:hypothetical protein